MNIYADALCTILYKRKSRFSIPVFSDVKQDFLLPRLLFNVILDSVLLVLTEQDGISWNLVRQLEDLIYIDDIYLLSHTLNLLQCKVNKLILIAKKVGLKINIPKAKYPKYCFFQHKQCEH